MRYNSISNIKYDKFLIGENVWAFNKLDGQNFGAVYNSKEKRFTSFTSRKHDVDENDEQFGKAVIYLRTHLEEELLRIIKDYSGKKKLIRC